MVRSSDINKRRAYSHISIQRERERESIGNVKLMGIHLSVTLKKLYITRNFYLLNGRVHINGKWISRLNAQ